MGRVTQEIEKVRKELIRLRRINSPFDNYLFVKNSLLLKQLMFFRGRFPELDM